MIVVIAKAMPMVGSSINRRPDEIDCSDCFARLDQFAGPVLADKKTSETLSPMQDHLDRCMDCREEFEALLRSLRAQSAASA